MDHDPIIDDQYKSKSKGLSASKDVFASKEGLTSKDDLWTLLSSMISEVNYKLIIALFIIFTFVISNVFSERVIKRFNNTHSGGQLTNYGIMLQGIFLVLGYMIVDSMIYRGFL